MPPLDHLIVTTSFLPDWKLFLGVMKPKSRTYPHTISADNHAIPSFPLVALGITIQGS
ncbi:hypothetical protein C8R47DRAFT_1215332 [Mycena vitilis]|nr:hypothetical protein C8R47DRAFT_1215332 [Mycena vitilis]